MKVVREDYPEREGFKFKMKCTEPKCEKKAIDKWGGGEYLCESLCRVHSPYRLCFKKKFEEELKDEINRKKM